MRKIVSGKSPRSCATPYPESQQAQAALMPGDVRPVTLAAGIEVCSLLWVSAVSRCRALRTVWSLFMRPILSKIKHKIQGYLCPWVFSAQREMSVYLCHLLCMLHR